VDVLDHVAAEPGALCGGYGERRRGLAGLLEGGVVAHLVKITDLEASQHHCLRTAYIFISVMRPCHKYVTFEQKYFTRFVDDVLHHELEYRVSKDCYGSLETEVFEARSGEWQLLSFPPASFHFRTPGRSRGLFRCYHGSAVFAYDYAAMRDAMRPLREELLRVVLHPRRALHVLYDDAAPPPKRNF
jgi:hypothetical protein